MAGLTESPRAVTAGNATIVTSTAPAATTTAASSTTATTQRNVSHAGLSLKKPVRSSTKLQRAALSAGALKSRAGSPSAITTTAAAPEDQAAMGKAQVHFALGNHNGGEDADEDEEEWIDASASASPHLSRNASMKSERSGRLGLDHTLKNINSTLAAKLEVQ